MAKVIFLHLPVIHSVHRGGGSASVHAGIPPPRDQTPLEQTAPPGADIPPGKQTPAYGLRAAGTYPTGMHSCLFMKIVVSIQVGLCRLAGNNSN